MFGEVLPSPRPSPIRERERGVLPQPSSMAVDKTPSFEARFGFAEPGASG
jgi:hypothetical protein